MTKPRAKLPAEAMDAGKAYRAWVAERRRIDAARDRFDDRIAEALEAGVHPADIGHACGLSRQAIAGHIERVRKR